MRNRNHTMPLAAFGLFVVCSTSANANDAATAASDHNCSLPSNIRSKVEHCNQVGDFGGHTDDTKYMVPGKTRPGYQLGGTRANPVIPKDPFKRTPGDDTYRRFKKDKDTNNNPPASKDQMLEIKSDSEPVKKETEPARTPPKEK